ncbi:MAG: AAA family ATPase [Planctomycetes bacterium]|nr:AAA family ATPase [Planctomycetota bacterium]
MSQTYTCREVATIAGVPRNTLLEWEREGKLKGIRRDEQNHRVYPQKVLEQILELVGKVAFKRISVVNQKGGVGKTTTSFNLAGCFANMGYRVLCVDLDAQANLSISFGLNPDEIELTSNNLLVDDAVTARHVVLKTRFHNIYLVPADIRLAGADIKLKEMLMKERILETKLRPYFDFFNIILFDCPPNLSTITINALVASTEALVPIETQCYSMKAIDDLTNTFNLLKEKMGHRLKTWILPTKIDRRVKLSNRMLEMLRHTFEGRLLSSIKTDANIAKAPLIKSPMVYCFPQSRSAKDYTRLAMELLNAPADLPEETPAPAAPFDEGGTTEGSSPFEFKEMPGKVPPAPRGGAAIGYSPLAPTPASPPQG